MEHGLEYVTLACSYSPVEPMIARPDSEQPFFYTGAVFGARGRAAIGRQAHKAAWCKLVDSDTGRS